METEEKVTTAAPVDAEESQTPESEATVKEPEIIDYSRLAQEERERRERAEKALAEKRFKSTHKEEEDPFTPTEEPLTESRLRAILREDRETLEKQYMSRDTERLAKELTTSEDEAKYVVEIYNSRVFPSYMTHEEKVRESYFIANGPRLLARQDELKRSLQGKQGVRRGGSENTHRDPATNEPKIDPQVRGELQRLGFTWDGKRYAKKLQNGKTLVRDAKTGKSHLEG